MRISENNVVMSKNELARLLLQNPVTLENARSLLDAARSKSKQAKGKKKSSTRGRKRNLRFSDKQSFKLLRVAPEFADRDATHGKILNAWAMLPGGVASVERLLGYLGYNGDGKEFHHGVINEVDNPLAWIRQTIKQALLRGDAELAGEANTEIAPQKETTESSPSVASGALNTSNDTEQSDGRKFGEGFGVGIQSNDVGPLP